MNPLLHAGAAAARTAAAALDSTRDFAGPLHVRVLGPGAAGARALADGCDRRRQGWAPSDIWNVDVWAAATLADALDATVDTAPPNTSCEEDALTMLDVAGRLRLLANDDAVWWENSQLSPSPLDAGTAALAWLAEAGDSLVDAAPLRTWAARAAAVLAELARTTHGYPPQRCPDMDTWVAELRAAGALAAAWHSGDTAAGHTFLTWLADVFPHLWD